MSTFNWQLLVALVLAAAAATMLAYGLWSPQNAPYRQAARMAGAVSLAMVFGTITVTGGWKVHPRPLPASVCSWVQQSDNLAAYESCLYGAFVGEQWEYPVVIDQPTTIAAVMAKHPELRGLDGTLCFIPSAPSLDTPFKLLRPDVRLGPGSIALCNPSGAVG